MTPADSQEPHKKPGDHKDLRKRTNRRCTRKALWFFCILTIISSGIYLILRGNKSKVITLTEVRDDKSQMRLTSNTEEKLKEAQGIEIPDASTYTIQDGDIPAEIFSKYGGYDANDVAAILAAAEGVYDFTQIRAGRILKFKESTAEKRASSMTYEPDDRRIITVLREGDEFIITNEEIAYDIRPEVVHVTIENSLYVDALHAGIQETTVIGVGQAFSYSLDFASQVRKGDTLSLLYERRTRDGAPATDGRVLAATFTNAGTKYHAYYFESKFGEEFGYYDEEAHHLKRQFLKAPLDFFRITSGYTGARLHPITKTVMAHYQIDYAAPSGTPTFSTARGTVTSMGFETGWGNIVRIKHDGGFSTHYAHLSSYATGLRIGSRIAQGQVIGYVGSTGWSTGPHVDYGMRRNGAPVNPLTIEIPKGPVLSDKDQVEFEKVRQEYETFFSDSQR